MFMKTIEPVFDNEFDLAYTIREYRAPLNTGIWFVRKNKRSISFIKMWMKYTRRYIKQFLKIGVKAVKDYAGIDQASLALSLKRKKENIKTLSLPCSEWNCIQSEIKQFGSTASVIHMKSNLRDLAINNKHSIDRPYLNFFVDHWNEYLK